MTRGGSVTSTKTVPGDTQATGRGVPPRQPLPIGDIPSIQCHGRDPSRRQRDRPHRDPCSCSPCVSGLSFTARPLEAGGAERPGGGVSSATPRRGRAFRSLPVSPPRGRYPRYSAIETSSQREHHRNPSLPPHCIRAIITTPAPWGWMRRRRRAVGVFPATRRKTGGVRLLVSPSHRAIL